MGTDYRARCYQCNHPAASPLDLVHPELPDGTWHPHVSVCRNKAECRERWWARLAYYWDLI